MRSCHDWLFEIVNLTSFKYNLDFRFERLVDGHFRRWWIFMNEKTIKLSFNDSYEFSLNCNWGEFIEKEEKNDNDFLNQLGMSLVEVARYIVPLFHSTKIIAASDKAEYQFLEDYLEAGASLDYSAVVFSKYFGLPLWITKLKLEKKFEKGTLFS